MKRRSRKSYEREVGYGEKCRSKFVLVRRPASRDLGPRDKEIIADFSGEELVTMPRNGRRPASLAICVHGVGSPGAETRSRAAPDAESGRSASRHGQDQGFPNNLSAFQRLRGQCTVRIEHHGDGFVQVCARLFQSFPCVFAPGSSSMNPMYPSGTFINTAVKHIWGILVIITRKSLRPPVARSAG